LGNPLLSRSILQLIGITESSLAALVEVDLTLDTLPSGVQDADSVSSCRWVRENLLAVGVHHQSVRSLPVNDGKAGVEAFWLHARVATRRVEDGSNKIPRQGINHRIPEFGPSRHRLLRSIGIETG
jgi:hypothetical protein